MAFTIRDEVEPLDPSLVPFFVYETFINQDVQVAIVTVLVYDALTTMDKEVRYFWKPPWKIVNTVYFANRYIGILGAIAFLFWNAYGVDMRTCNFAVWTKNITNWVTLVLIDYILMIRVLALYSQDRLLSICLRVLLAGEAVLKLGIVIYLVYTQHVAVGGLAQNVTICGDDNPSPWRWGVVDWVIPMAYGVILLILALYKAAGYWRMSVGFKGFTLVKVVVMDQLVYFVLVVACCIINTLQFKILISNPIVEDVLFVIGNPSLLCILGSRLLVNLKEAAEYGLNEGTNYRITTPTLTEMQFM